MTDSQLQLDHVQVNVAAGATAKALLKDISLALMPGDFVAIIGTNGAGKSTLFNSITGDLPLAGGQITLANQRIDQLTAEQRAKHIARVFQDPKLGTAPRMTVAENLALAARRGQTRRLRLRGLKAQMAAFTELAAKTGNGLELALTKPTEQLSGGQRQALSLLMATMTEPDLLLLDEHTAALDPKTSATIMALTAEMIASHHLTALMITHQLSDALKYGNRLVVLDSGRIVADYAGEAKAKLTAADLQQYY